MPPDQPPSRGRPRRHETDLRIVEAALGLLRERGPAAVNVETVAARSGVAKTTIYRRYRDRDDLLRTVLEQVAEPVLPPAELSTAERLRWVLARAREVLESGLGRGGVAAVLLDSDPAFVAGLRASLTEHLAPLTRMIASEADAGRLRRDLDPDILLNLVFGAYLGEVLRYGTPRPQWLDGTHDLLLAALTPENR